MRCSLGAAILRRAQSSPRFALWANAVVAQFSHLFPNAAQCPSVGNSVRGRGIPATLLRPCGRNTAENSSARVTSRRHAFRCSRGAKALVSGDDMSTLLSDLRLAWRSLSKDRGFLTTALITIALGVGGNTAVFSVVKAVLIEPLPYADSSRLVALHETVADAPGERYQISYANFLDWKRQARSFESMAAFCDYAFTVRIGDLLERVGGPGVSWNYFDVLGVRPQVGRSFLPADDQPTAARVVILSDALWERAFRRDPTAVGRSILLDGNSYSVVGIMPAA